MVLEALAATERVVICGHGYDQEGTIGGRSPKPRYPPIQFLVRAARMTRDLVFPPRFGFADIVRASAVRL
jgi:hypothetical protein